MQLLTVNGKSRSHWRMAEWLVLSQLILRVPLLERGLSSSCRSGLLRKLCAVQIWMSSVFSCCCAGISGKKWSLVFSWECCVSYFLLGLWGNASCAFYFCSQLHKDKLKSLNFWTLKKKKSKAFKDWLSFLFNLVLENVEWGGTYKISVCIK